MKTSRWTSLRCWLATLVMVPVLMFGAAPAAAAQASGGAATITAQSSRPKRPRRVPESGVLATMGIALAAIASTALYRRRRRE